MKILVGRTIIMLVSVVFIGMLFLSCRTQHAGCPAYGGEAKKYKIERGY
ncbi:MAG: hypothetical protein NTU44_17155 [Bacteroidetes bacterium]|nr:hypothetical protein [Bacteroidota bacterium]